MVFANLCGLDNLGAQCKHQAFAEAYKWCYFLLSHANSFELNNLVQLLMPIILSIRNYFREHNI